MRILYIAPRLHPNQLAVLQGWIERGDEVRFLSQIVGHVEDHSVLKPVMLGNSAPFERFDRVMNDVFHRNTAYDKYNRRKFAAPPRDVLMKELREFRPELVILREKSVYSMVCERACRKLGIRTLLYNQSPLWIREDEVKRDFAHRMAERFLPGLRMTPVRQIGTDRTGRKPDENAFFVPFITKPHCAPDNRSYLADGTVHLLEVGRFELRKNHAMMLDVFERLIAEDGLPELHLTIVGECSDPYQEELYRKLEQRAADSSLEGKVTLLRNLSHAEMTQQYRNADLFILPSTNEPAAISPIEAMSYAVPAISGTGNGTADYIEDGVCGALFRDQDADDLYGKLREIVSLPEQIPVWGEAAYRNICEHYTFRNYYDALREHGLIR